MVPAVALLRRAQHAAGNLSRHAKPLLHTCKLSLAAPSSTPGVVSVARRNAPWMGTQQRAYSILSWFSWKKPEATESHPAPANKSEATEPDRIPGLQPPFKLQDLSKVERRAYEQHGPNFQDHLSPEDLQKVQDSRLFLSKLAVELEGLLGDDWYNIWTKRNAIRDRARAVLIQGQRKARLAFMAELEEERLALYMRQESDRLAFLSTRAHRRRQFRDTQAKARKAFRIKRETENPWDDRYHIEVASDLLKKQNQRWQKFCTEEAELSARFSRRQQEEMQKRETELAKKELEYLVHDHHVKEMELGRIRTDHTVLLRHSKLEALEWQPSSVTGHDKLATSRPEDNQGGPQ